LKRTVSIAALCAALLLSSVTSPSRVGAATSTASKQRTAAAIAKELAGVRSQVSSAGNQYDRALRTLENTSSRINSTDRRIKQENDRLAAAEVLLGERVAAMYRTDQESDAMLFLLGSTTFDDFITRADLVEMIGDRDAALVGEVKETRASLERSKAALVKDRSSQASQLSSFKKKRDALQRQLGAVQAQYARLLGELSAAMAREKAAGLSTWTPKGPNGMVFPVRGAHYYSNTWGAARSGGRHHKGTDVMAPRGTPIVAVASGTIRSSSGGLGGLTITQNGDNGWTYYYAHMNGFAVRSGRVRAGQLIGWVGSTGNARGGAPHLHFQMGPGARWVNPYPYLRQME
jgi:murein DD-endopeptidase MepM/ murein hydrolase activator NlpD